MKGGRGRGRGDLFVFGELWSTAMGSIALGNRDLGNMWGCQWLCDSERGAARSALLLLPMYVLVVDAYATAPYIPQPERG